MDIDAFAKKNQEKIKLFLGFLLIFVLGFSAGNYYRDAHSSGGDIVIQDAATDCSDFFNKEAKIDDSGNVGTVASVKSEKTAEVQESDVAIKAFAGSKNSNLYHKATCQYVKRIKAENIVWFSSAEEAEKSGRKPHSCVYE
jgi:hypothetical protein